jgi:hypothetical protein
MKSEMCSVITAHFALESTIDHIMMRKPPYEELSDKEAEARDERRQFPCVDTVQTKVL